MREYSIDLPFALSEISWRRFLVLLYNLSGESLLVNTIRARKSGKIAIEAEGYKGEKVLKQFFG